MQAPLVIILGICCLLASRASFALETTGPGLWQTVQAPTNSQPTDPKENSSTSEAQSDKPSPSSPAPVPVQVPDQAKSSESTSTKNAKSKEHSTKKAASKKRAVVKKGDTETEPSADKVVVRNGGTGEPSVQLSPRLSQEQASQQRNTTDKLLAITDANLKQISGQQLSSTQQDSVTQIRSYMQQAKAANSAGDLERAHNLAFKAQLLSNELVGH
ncbi:MAG TPA: hypothetical protein VFA74_17110 [Terriglobales bacterium]|nr:hypothetical protein [Terriglobales bacterium]